MPCRPDRDFSGPFKWKAISPRTDSWKSYCGDFMSDRKQKTVLVAPGQQGVFIVSAPTPYRPDDVNHPRSAEPVATGDFSLTRGTAGERAAGRQQFGARGGMDGAIHAAAPEERGIGRVHDRVHRLPGNVVLNNLDAFGHGIARSEPAG